MKQKFLFFIIFIGIVIFISCNKKIVDSIEKDNKKPILIGVIYDSGGIGDHAFNDTIERGIQRAEKEIGVKIIKITSRLDIDYKPSINYLIKQNVDLIVTTRGNTINDIYTSAKLYPKTKFVCVDSAISLSNVRSLVYREEEGSFLVGYLSGLVSKTKKIGFIGGFKLPMIEKFYSGYAAGVYMAQRSCTLLPQTFINTFEDTEKGYLAAKLLYSKGADVIFQAAGGAGRGVLKAAKEQKRYAIGVDSDQDDLYPGYVLTSVVKRCDTAVFDAIKDFKQGSFKSGVFLSGVKEGGIELTDLRHTKSILTQEMMRDLDKVKQAIVKGKITIPKNQDQLNLFLKKVTLIHSINDWIEFKK